VGQTDLPVPLVRNLAARTSTKVLVGVSTTREEQILQGVNDRADYLAIGPVFGTQNKTNPNPTLGVSRLRELADYARTIGFSGPLVAIGGIDLENARTIGSIVDAAAIIGGLLPASSGQGALQEVRDRAKTLHEMILEAGTKATP